MDGVILIYVLLWNELPFEIRKSKSLDIFNAI